jgi:hypothetical protein
MSRGDCVDCHVNTFEIKEYYVVTTKTWRKAGMKHPFESGDGMLCIGCLESRLGRKLTSRDFYDCPANQGGLRDFSKRLYNRLMS